MKRTILLVCGIVLAISVGQSDAQPPAVPPFPKKPLVDNQRQQPAVKLPAVTTPEIAVVEDSAALNDVWRAAIWNSTAA
ncbi:MAG: hypothetical protein WCO86_10605 [Planctomycetota bacterium]